MISGEQALFEAHALVGSDRARRRLDWWGLRWLWWTCPNGGVREFDRHGVHL